ncbi:vWA domain-containing protein [Vibrio nereis]|uniref:vWA domain-containing protein n=1 Tax=Vibrio nereis TaxID=693 RepID=UPI0024949D63|nr:VWA domain-containing protein [Vibrio nereis]
MDNLKHLTIVASLLSLTACGGGDSDNASGDTTSTPDVPVTSSYTYSGSLVIPEGVAVKSSRAMYSGLINPLSAECPNVPDGYAPMANAKVTLEDSAGLALGAQTTTDNCGVFLLQVPKEDTNVENAVISASLDGFKTLKAHAENFVPVEDGTESTVVASTIPSDSTYVISAIQKASGDELMFSVTDSSTNNAVIQLTKAAFTVSVNDQPISISTLNSSDQLGVASSNTLTLDRSGSMDNDAKDENNNDVVDSNGVTYNLSRLTALAAHQFVSEKNTSDEVAVIPFATYVHMINDLFLQTFMLSDEQGQFVSYAYSESGFTQEQGKLHFAIDMYNPHSGLWDNKTQYDQRHTGRTDNIASVGVANRWGFSTALERAVNESLTVLTGRNNAIKRAFVMTDGKSRFYDRAGVIDTAKQNSIPVHSIALGVGADEEDLKAISEQTGGSYYKVLNPSDIVGIYSSLQTTVKYAYLAGLNAPLLAGDVVKLSLEINGEEVTRELTIQ